MLLRHLRPLDEQVIVITGASSGIGLVTAEMAGTHGACVVLVARNAADLARAAQTIRDAGGRAVVQVADVADPGQVERIAETAMAEFGRIDTWVNNAAVSIYGRLTDLSLDDMRRQMDVNFWGTVHGSRTAVSALRSNGGALINVASALADRAIPLQGGYCATKHAVKAFTDSLRMELEEESTPISVTLIKPSSMDTPLFEKAKTLLGREPQPIPPVYKPEVCARAILAAAERPIREVFVGASGKLMATAQKISPRLTDRYMEKKTFAAQVTDIPAPPDRANNLYEPVENDGGEHGRNWSGRTKGTSVYTWAKVHPGAAVRVAAIAGLGLVAFAGWRRVRSTH